ncbi:immunoglobulin superfamily member 2 isoform X2 [Dipodomys merriami]|uniref:immunoglobulin superfamily member 2 isoform X2 n=1 Tax=Dipodomys merriami TaxID=94247 RepID=UPI003855A2D3
MAQALCVTSLLLFLRLSAGQREVRIQAGPLFRAAGYPTSISCNVSGYQGPSEQHFRWSVYLPQAPSREVQIVSTQDASFPYAVYARRVSSKGIYVERMLGNSVLLHITQLQMLDTGEYECHTPSTDDKYFGSYSAKTNLTATEFTVSVTTNGPVAEGQPLHLVCLVLGSAQAPQLQGFWFLNGVEIAQIDADGVVGLKKEYEDRARQGQLQVSKPSPKSFSLRIFSAGPEDAGTYSCTVVEVTRTPEGSWHELQRKRSPASQVHPRRPAARSVVVLAKEQAVWEGETLTLVCKAGGAPSPLWVSWWHIPQDQPQPRLVAGMEPDGSVQLGASPGSPHYHGNMRLKKVDWATFWLEIPSTTVTDGGTYQCKVSERLRHTAPDQPWMHNVSVTVKSLKSSLQVHLMSRQPHVMLANTFTLSCVVAANFSALKLPLSVVWRFQPAGSRAFHQLVHTAHDGSVEWGTLLPQFHERTKVSRTGLRSQLLIHEATEEDSGMYRCEVDVYDRNAQSSPRASASSYPLRIVVSLPESKLKVSSASQAQEIAISSTAHIDCSIESRSTGNLPFTIIWYFSPISAEASWVKILEIDQSNIVIYGDEFRTPQRKEKFYIERVSPALFRLHVVGMEDSNQGRYRCEVGEWLSSTNGTWKKLGEQKSGLTELRLRPTGSRVRVSKAHWTGNATEHEEVDIPCGLQALGTMGSLYSVTWYRGGPGGPVQLLSLQYDGLQEPGKDAAGRGARILGLRVTPTDFVLKLRPVQMEDAGLYWCVVAEWRLHGSPGKWVSQASDGSQHMELRVLPAELTFPSRICSQPLLVHFLVVCPLVLLVLLLLSLLCMLSQARKRSRLRPGTQKAKAVLVGPGGVDSCPAEDQDGH